MDTKSLVSPEMVNIKRILTKTVTSIPTAMLTKIIPTSTKITRLTLTYTKTLTTHWQNTNNFTIQHFNVVEHLIAIDALCSIKVFIIICQFIKIASLLAERMNARNISSTTERIYAERKRRYKKCLPVEILTDSSNSSRPTDLKYTVKAVGQLI